MVGNPGLDLVKDEKKAENSKNNEDVPAELTRNVVINKRLPILPFGFLISKGRLVYNEECDKNAKL